MLHLRMAATFCLAVMPSLADAGERALLMFQREGCSYCRRWDAEIAPAYPRTPEGQAAPLIRLDIKDPLPDGVTLTGRTPAFTPTFVLTDDGTEVARIEGYAGDEFFWVLLADMLRKSGWAPAAAPPQSDVQPQSPAQPSTAPIPPASQEDPA